MELMSLGLLIGVIGMLWLLAASSIQDNESQIERRDFDRHAGTRDTEGTSAEIKERRARAAA